MSKWITHVSPCLCNCDGCYFPMVILPCCSASPALWLSQTLDATLPCFIGCICDELITRPEDSYRLWCVVVCDLEKQPQEWGGHDLRCVAAPQKKLWFGFVGNKSKGKVQLIICCESTKEEKKYSYTLSLTSALNGVGVGGHASAACLP